MLYFSFCLSQDNSFLLLYLFYLFVWHHGTLWSTNNWASLIAFLWFLWPPVSTLGMVQTVGHVCWFFINFIPWHLLLNLINWSAYCRYSSLSNCFHFQELQSCMCIHGHPVFITFDPYHDSVTIFSLATILFCCYYCLVLAFCGHYVSNAGLEP